MLERVSVIISFRHQPVMIIAESKRLFLVRMRELLFCLSIRHPETSSFSFYTILTITAFSRFGMCSRNPDERCLSRNLFFGRSARHLPIFTCLSGGSPSILILLIHVINHVNPVHCLCRSMNPRALPPLHNLLFSYKTVVSCVFSPD